MNKFYNKFLIAILLINSVFIQLNAFVIKPVYPTTFSSSKKEDLLRDFLEENKSKSLSAKFLTESAGDFDLSEFISSLKTIENEELVKEIIGREAERGHDHFVFYNAASNAVKFFHMVRGIIYKQKNKDIESYLVMSPIDSSSNSAKDFLENYLDSNPKFYDFSSSYVKALGVFDHRTEVRSRLLAGSMLLTDGRWGETPWSLFSENASIAIGSGEEDNFLQKVLPQSFTNAGYKFTEKELSDLTAQLIKIYNAHKESISPQLLQIFVKKNDFNRFGYSAYAGGVPIVEDSASFLEQLNKNMMASKSSNWEKVLKALIREKFDNRELYHLADLKVPPTEKIISTREDGSQNFPDWLDFLQIRLVVNNYEIYDPKSDSVFINEYYPLDNNFLAVNKLKNALEDLLESHLK